MKSIHILSITLLLFNQTFLAQEKVILQTDTLTIIEEKIVEPENWLKKIRIRKSFETKSENDEKPAIVSFTMPKGNNDFYTINAGIGYQLNKLKNNKANQFAAYFVYNKNTEIDKRQENYKIGINHNILFNLKNELGLILDNSSEYLNDNALKKQSILVQTYLSPRYNQSFLVMNSYRIGGKFAYKFDPKIGLEYQNSYDVSIPIDNGYQLRSFFNLGGSILMRRKTLISKKYKIKSTLHYSDGTIEVDEKEYNIIDALPKNQWSKSLELAVNYEGRNTLLESFEANTKYSYFFKGEFRYYPLMDKNFSVNISFNKGANPIDGLEKQEFWMFSLSYKK